MQSTKGGEGIVTRADTENHGRDVAWKRLHDKEDDE